MNTPTRWGDKPYYSLDAFLKESYGEKVYKLALDGGTTCPNRDGRIAKGGCIFCSSGGSGEFAGDRRTDIPEQIRAQKEQLLRKRPVRRFIAYFQAYTGTYAPIQKLCANFMAALADPDVCAISIATRPDCLPPEVIDLLKECNAIKPVWIELGLQTIHETTARYIRRGYPLSVFEEAVDNLKKAGITQIITHLIIGLPGEDRSMLLKSIDYLNHLPVTGVKLQLLHVLKHTDLAADYQKGTFEVLDEDTYIQLVIDCLTHLDPRIVIHRVTGDGPADLLIAPLWSCKKRNVLNHLHHELSLQGAWQGKELLYDQ